MIPPPKLTQMGAVHARGARGARQIPVMATQELGDVSALPTYERSLFRSTKRQRVIERLASNGWSDFAARLISDCPPQRRITEQDRPLDGSTQLTNIARPIMPRELVQEILRCTRMPGELFVEGLDEQWNVIAALAERGQSQADDVEPVVEIGAERTTVDGCAQVLMGGGDDANVDADLIAPADALDHALFDHAEQSRLQVERQLSNLVEEYRATGRALDRADARSSSAGERALLVAEQLALDQRRRNRAAVDNDERSAAARARLMNGLRQQRLARPGLALDQDSRVGACDARQRLEHTAHGDRSTNRAAEIIIGGKRLLGVVLSKLEPQRREPDLEHGAGIDPGGFDAVLPKKNSVGGAHIPKVSTALCRGNEEVIAGDSGIGQDQRVPIGGAAGNFAARIEDDRATIGSVDHSYAQAPVGERLGAHANNVGRHPQSIPRIMSDMVDAVSRRYEIVCRLAGGGMADLYLARTRGPGGFERTVVIKRVAKKLESQPSAVQALLDEARIAATLSHANIVQVNDIEMSDGQVSIVMEFLHGHDVAHLLRKMRRNGEPVPLDQAVAIVLGVCAGLHHAHERVDSEGKSLDIVHRDVSPHNVFVTYDGAVKLVDFGIARAAGRKGNTEAGFIKGKPGYIAPEHIRGRKTDRRCDVWGAAVLLYELTTGELPYGTGAGFEDLARVTKQDAPLPSTKVASYPPELEAIVMRGLARDPAQRYQTAEAMRTALEEFARAHSLDLSPFRMAALIERVFAENLEAWRQSQRLGKSLAEHVAAFKTSGGHDAVDLPGDPTEPVPVATSTNPLVTDDFLQLPHTAPTKLIKPSSITGPTKLVKPAKAKAPVVATAPTEPSPLPPTLVRTEPERPTPLAFESLQFAEATTLAEADILVEETPATAVLKPRWRKPVAIVLSAPLVLFLSLLAWGSLDSNHPARPSIGSQTQTRATADNAEPVAQPGISVVPIESEPALPAEPAANESSIEIRSAVAHATPTPARKRPAVKTPKRRVARTMQPPRAAPSPAASTPSQPAEDDLDALLPH